MKALGPLLAALVVAAPLCAANADASSALRTDDSAPIGTVKQRVVILSDVENEPDDTMSFVRLFLYANQIDIEAIVATTSIHMRNEIHPESVRRILDAYGRVQPNLLKHEPGYPTAKSLQAKVFAGQPSYGLAAVGDGKDSPGSAEILRLLDDADPRPLWVTAWGGPNTLAQALHHLRLTRTPADQQRLLAKLRVYTISDQDDSGAWIRRNFPDLFYIVSPGGYGNATWSGIMEKVEGIDNTSIGNAWLAKNIQQGHGEYGALYPDVSYGMEGDTPSFLSLIPNGLSDPEHPEWGGWGGRYALYTPLRKDTDPDGFTGGVPVETESRPIWSNAVDTVVPYVANDVGRAFRPLPAISSFRASVWRWRDAFQHDFAARLAWTTQPYAKANHPPVAALAHADRLTVTSGERFTLDASGSRDPDGDSLSYRWFNYAEAGTLDAPIPAQGAENGRRTHFQAPVVTKPELAHFILEVTDKGEPSLTRYRRVLVSIQPAR
ncbi:MAG TPA: nucleoside hydrolase-like domain-containing protein [Steroidobacteraceae bacterium]|nr:nucleoside hydrolase-like domain-containing protein [Steroidobacteraceae bacterium]